MLMVSSDFTNFTRLRYKGSAFLSVSNPRRKLVSRIRMRTGINFRKRKSSLKSECRLMASETHPCGPSVEDCMCVWSSTCTLQSLNQKFHILRLRDPLQTSLARFFQHSLARGTRILNTCSCEIIFSFVSDVTSLSLPPGFFSLESGSRFVSVSFITSSKVCSHTLRNTCDLVRGKIQSRLEAIIIPSFVPTLNNLFHLLTASPLDRLLMLVIQVALALVK
mmetsp:Transcript_32039/g.51572  ORF Transcript_32039/g.51572 Transcript_32039/m.51572 type:complete len:221 (+) Transcript_32039:533-1195(+)